MGLVAELQRAWVINEVNKEALTDFSRDFNLLVDELSPAFSLDGAVWNDASRREHGVTTSLNNLETFVKLQEQGGYLKRNDAKIEAGLCRSVKHGKFQGWVEKLAIGPIDIYSGRSTEEKINIRNGLADLDTRLKRGEMLGLLALQAAKRKALLRKDGIRDYYKGVRDQAKASIELYEKAAEILFDRVDNAAEYDLPNLLELACRNSSVDTKKVVTMVGLSFAMAGCVGSAPTEASPNFDPAIVTEPAAIVETANAPTAIPSPESGVKRVEVTAVEYSGEELKEKLKSYEEAKVYSYDSDGGLIVLEGIDKPTGKAAFTVDGKEYITAFGVNGESYIMYKDGARFVATEFDNLRTEDGYPIENAFGYHLYIDPATRQVADKIDATMWRIPVFTILKDLITQKNILLHFSVDDLLLGDKGFKQVISRGKPVDGMLSITSPELFKDIDTAHSFVQEINFEGDWKVVFDDDGNILLIDAKNGEEIGEFLKGKWVEANETVTMGGVILTLDENGVVKDMEATGADAETKADNLAKVDPAAWGLEVGDGEGQAQIVKGSDGTHIVVDGQDVAKWVGTEWEWDGTMMGKLSLFDGFAKTYPTTDTGAVRQTNEVQADAKEIRAFAEQEAAMIGGSQRNYTIYLYDDLDRSEAVVARVLTNGKVLDPNKDKSGVVDGWICFKTTTGELVRMKFSDIEVFIRGFN